MFKCSPLHTEKPYVRERLLQTFWVACGIYAGLVPAVSQVGLGLRALGLRRAYHWPDLPHSLTTGPSFPQ